MALKRAWDLMTNAEKITYCQKIADEYPENHREIRNIMAQIERIKRNEFSSNNSDNNIRRRKAGRKKVGRNV